jgi:hypothetical protein
MQTNSRFPSHWLTPQEQMDRIFASMPYLPLEHFTKEADPHVARPTRDDHAKTASALIHAIRQEEQQRAQRVIDRHKARARAWRLTGMILWFLLGVLFAQFLFTPMMMVMRSI